MTVLDAIPQWARNLSPFRESIQQAEQALDQTRAGKNKQIAALRDQLAKGMPAHHQAVSEAIGKEKAAAIALEAAKEITREAEKARHNFKWRLENQIDRLEAELRSDVPGLIEAFRMELLDLHTAERLADFDVLRGLDTTGREDKEIAVSNSEAKKARLLRMTEIIREEIPRLQLLPHAEVPAAIQQLRESIPECHGVWNCPITAAQIEKGPDASWFDFRKVMSGR